MSKNERMGTRTTAAVLLGVVLTLLAACSKQGCSDLPVTGGIQVQVPTAIQKVARTMLVELCQGSRCRSVTFPSTANEPDGTVADGITRRGDAYDIDLARFGNGWKADTVGGLTITGAAKKGRVVLNHTDQFTFTSAYPNGKDCDDSPALTYSTSVGGEDLVG